MELHELMINDYVSYKGQPRRVNEHTPHYFMTRKDLFCPIKLTDDILKQLGFKVYSYKNGKLYYKSSIVDLTFEFESDRYNIDGTKLNILYVHELQHILRLDSSYKDPFELFI